MADTLRGLAAMHAHWPHLSSSLRLALLTELSKAAAEASPRQLAAMLAALGRVGLTWQEDAPDQLQHTLAAALARRAAGMTEVQLSACLFSLGSMGLRWEGLPEGLRGALAVALERINVARERRLAAADSEAVAGVGVGAGDAHSPVPVPVPVPAEGLEGSEGSEGSEGPEDGVVSVVAYLERRNPAEASEAAPEWVGVAEGEARGRPGRARGARQRDAHSLALTAVGLSRLAATWAQLPPAVVGSLEAALRLAAPAMTCAQVRPTHIHTFTFHAIIRPCPP